MHRGEIYLVDFSTAVVGSEQSGVRPAVIVQNELGNKNSTTTIVVPLTSKTKTQIGTHVILSPSDCGILRESTALCEQLRVIDKQRLIKKLGEVTNREKIADLNRKIQVSLGL